MSGQVTIPKTRAPAIGPILGATVVTPSIDAVIEPYREAGFVQSSRPANWGALPSVLQSACVKRTWLSGDSQSAWLQLIEIPSAVNVDRYRHTGWFSLEVGSSDVEALAQQLRGCEGFKTLAGPAPLEVSEDIVAMQVIGPSGELYYFTEVKRPLPPFVLPELKHRLDELFIAVATTRDRNAALDFWTALSGVPGMRFDTRIGVLNRGLGLPANHRLPVAIAQLDGANLIEIDQIPVADKRPPLATGIAMISVAAAVDRHVQGADGEWLELVSGKS